MLAIACLGCEASAPQGSGSAPAAQVKLTVVDEKELAQVLEQQRGKVVLLDFWATWCEPCRELFPHTVHLHRQYADQGLSVLAVSLDEPESQEDVLRFLTTKQADFPNFLSRYGTSPQSMTAFEIPETLPHARLYDRQGKLVRSFEGPFQAADLEQAVREQLSRP